MNKNLYKIYIIVTVFLIASGCKEKEIEVTSLATVTVANVVLGGNATRLNDYLRDNCAVMNYNHFTVKAGTSVPLRFFSAEEPNTPYFNQRMNLVSGGLYSLFLGGTSTIPESVWVKDDIPPYSTEAIINVRIVNMAPGSVPLNLTIGSSPTVKLVTEISYKQVSEFKSISFPDPLPANGGVFQIRDGNGNLLTSYAMPSRGTLSAASARRRNITLVVKGIVGASGTNAFGIVPVAHYIP